MVQIEGRTRADQVRRNQRLQLPGAVHRDVARVPTVTLGRGKPLVQVISSAGEPVPYFWLQPVGAIERHDLIPAQPGASVSHGHETAPASRRRRPFGSKQYSIIQTIADKGITLASRLVT